jgi:hypothetical protein
MVKSPGNRSGTPEADASRWVAQEQIAAAVRYLCSEEAASINGRRFRMMGARDGAG